MSLWRNIVIELAARGPLSSAEIAFYVHGEVRSGLMSAKALGLVCTPGRGGNPGGKWTLTQRGVDFAENRVSMVWARPGGRRWVATWLSSLPRGCRINVNQSPTQPTRHEVKSEEVCV